MTIEIPSWLLWTAAVVVGVPSLLAVIALAAFGWMAAKAMSGFRLK